jgi:hypothetical protein
MSKQPAAPVVNVLTNRYHNTRSGANLEETELTPDKINVEQFGKLFSRTVDGDLYSQPLIVTGVRIGEKTRRVVYLATSRNWVYAYDAEEPDESLPLWQVNLGPPVPRSKIPPETQGGLYTNFGSEVGITSTPVIDRPTNEDRGVL